METNELLQEKWDVQKELSQKANYDINLYFELVDKIVNEMVKKYHIQLKFSNPESEPGKVA